MPNAFTKRMKIRMRRNGSQRADKSPRYCHKLPDYMRADAHGPDMPQGGALVPSPYKGHGGRRIDRKDNGARLLPDLTGGRFIPREKPKPAPKAAKAHTSAGGKVGQHHINAEPRYADTGKPVVSRWIKRKWEHG